MATKPAAKTPAVKKPRKPRAPGLNLSQKFRVSDAIKAADPAMPDADLAAHCTKLIGLPIARIMVKNYRTALGLASVNKSPTALKARVAELEAENAALKAQLAEHTPPLV